MTILSYDGYNRPASIIKSSYSYVLSHDVSISILRTFIFGDVYVYMYICVYPRKARRCINHISKSIIEHDTMRDNENERCAITIKAADRFAYRATVSRRCARL